jgi:drug/metabolite transporter (DMT)-like permease
VFLGESLSKNFWGWAAVALFGAFIVSFPDLRPTGVVWDSNMLGVTLALSAAFFWGGSTVFGRFALNRISFQMMTSLRFLSGLVCLFVMNLYSGTLGQVTAASPADWLFVFITAILAGFVALLIYYYGLRSTEASIATLCELAFPFAAVVVNWKLLDAALSPTQILGGAILLFAIWRLTAVNETDLRERAIEPAPGPA